MDTQAYPQVEDKAWGKKIKLAPGIDIMMMKAGHRTSWHMHKKNRNIFQILKGEAVLVSVSRFDCNGTMEFNEIGSQYYETQCSYEDDWHEVRAATDCVILEHTYNIYGVCSDFGDDIIRDPSQLGGPFDPEAVDA